MKLYVLYDSSTSIVKSIATTIPATIPSGQNMAIINAEDFVGNIENVWQSPNSYYWDGQKFNGVPAYSGTGGGTSSSSTLRNNRALVSTRGVWYVNGSATGAVSPGTTYICRHVTTTNASDISFMFANPPNGYQGYSGQAITVSAGIDTNGNGAFSMTFGGQTSITIQPGTVVTSDPVTIEIPKGTTFYSHTCVSVPASGNVIPLNMQLWGTDQGSVVGNSVGTAGLTPTTTGTKGYTPIAIVGTPNKGEYTPSIFYVGDSIAYGYYDSDPLDSEPDFYGFVPRALNGNYGWYGYPKPGEVAYHFNQQSNQTAWHHPALAPAQYCTHAIVEFGQNDLQGNQTAAQIQTSLTNLYNALTQRGIKVFGTTITPYTTSTDSFATTTNQSPYSSAMAPGSYLTQVNDWLRNNWSSLGLSGLFDTADAVMTARDSCIWKVGYVYSDGLHPSPTGHQAMANTIDTTKFT